MLRVDFASDLRQPKRKLPLLPDFALLDHRAHTLQQLFNIGSWSAAFVFGGGRGFGGGPV